MTQPEFITTSPDSNSDAALFAAIERHSELLALMECSDDPTRYNTADVEAQDIEDRIVGMPVSTQAGLAAKQAFILRTQYISREPGLDCGDLHRLVGAILTMDEERIGRAV